MFCFQRATTSRGRVQFCLSHARVHHLLYRHHECGWCANEATRELDPFGGDGNDFSIIDFNCPPINGLMEIGAALVVTRECEEQLARPNEPSRAALEIKRRENQIRPPNYDLQGTGRH